jgi:hypothetical protein
MLAGDAQFQFAPEIGAPIAGLQAERARKRAVQVDAAELGLGKVDRLVAMRIQAVREMAQRSGLAHAGLTGQQADAGTGQQPLEAFGQACECAVVPEFGAVLVQRRMPQAEVLTVHSQSSSR